MMMKTINKCLEELVSMALLFCIRSFFEFSSLFSPFFSDFLIF